MVQLMRTTMEESPELQWHKGKNAAVKLEFEDALDEAYGPLNKRSKLSSSSSLQQQLVVGADGFPVPPSQYNPLDEPSPLGLRLRKSPSLLDLIQMKLSQGNNAKVGNQGKKEQKGNSGTIEKLKASNFPATVLRIGSWEYKSRYEGDLVAKCYFAKHKLVWEVLDGGLKNKIEIQWSDIMGLKANYPDDGPGTLDVVLSRQPLFFRETNPQPRKHTLWQATSDFTGGQASMHKRHYLQIPQGLLGKHFEKLIQCDPRLNFLSQQPEIILDSPHFETRNSVFEDPNVCESEFNLNNERSPPFLNLHGAASPSGAHCSSTNGEQDFVVSRRLENIRPETPSPSSVIDTRAIQDVSRDMEQLKGLDNLDQIRVPGLHPSMSMKDLVSHFEQRFSEQGTSEVISLSSDERQSLEILEEISRCLFSDTQNMPASDEKSLMTRVNSLCCLLQKDPATAHKSENYGGVAVGGKRTDELISFFPGATSGKKIEDPSTSENKSNDPTPSMSRKDSIGDLLLNLPRIASLPQFLFNIYEDSDHPAEAREKEAREKASAAKAEAEVRRRAERAAVERAAAEARERAAADARERAAAAARMNQQKNDDDLESFFNMGSRANSTPKTRTSSVNETSFASQFQNKAGAGGPKPTFSSTTTSSNRTKASSTTSFADDLSSIFGAATSSGDFQEVEGETEERRRARLERHQRTQERAAKALAEKNQRDLQVQMEQQERHRISESLDIEIKRWAAGKEGNLRALLSTMQYVLWPECGWQPVSLTDLITGASVKKVYRKATLCIHPDKVQQKGATLQQKYVAEKVFDMLKEAWNKFNSEELF